MNPRSVTATINARLQPLDRGDLLEDPLGERLGEAATITGAGTLQGASGEIASCDIEIDILASPDETEQLIVDTLERLGAPRGSTLHVPSENRTREFGRAEGLALYLNGTDLPAETYAECDVNFVYGEIDRLLAPNGRVWSYWEGPSETALYAYGPSFAEMKERLAELLATYPLCAKCRVVQIA